MGGVLGEVVQGAGAVGDGLAGDAVAGEQGAGQGDGAADGALAGQGFCIAGEILQFVSEARRPADRPLRRIPGSSGGPVRRIPMIVVG